VRNRGKRLGFRGLETSVPIANNLFIIINGIIGSRVSAVV
jgi:hypothetical protein